MAFVRQLKALDIVSGRIRDSPIVRASQIGGFSRFQYLLHPFPLLLVSRLGLVYLAFLVVRQFQIPGHLYSHGPGRSVDSPYRFQEFPDFGKAFFDDGIRNRDIAVFSEFRDFASVGKSEFLDGFFVRQSFFHERNDLFERFHGHFGVSFRNREIANGFPFFGGQAELFFELDTELVSVARGYHEFDQFFRIDGFPREDLFKNAR
jgi:hypothetical protein